MAGLKSNVNIIIGGASLTNTHWPSWADVVKHRYPGNHINTSRKGLGNEVILLRMLNAAYQAQRSGTSTFLIPMLTNVDKWDWYIDRTDQIEKYNKEKHPLASIGDAPGGFWSTGSWFPLEKEIYQQNFYSQDYFTLRSLQILSMFKQVCDQQGWKYLILFDSPVWSMTEQELNEGQEVWDDHRLVNTPLCQWYYQCSGAADGVYEPGFIGFLYERKMNWFSERWKCHPSSLSHLAFAREHIIPVLDQQLEHNNDDSEINDMMARMDNLWYLSH